MLQTSVSNSSVHDMAWQIYFNIIKPFSFAIGCASQANKLLCLFLKTICIPVLNIQQHKEYFWSLQTWHIFRTTTYTLPILDSLHLYMRRQMTSPTLHINKHQGLSSWLQISTWQIFREKQEREGEIRRWWVRLLIVPTLRAYRVTRLECIRVLTLLVRSADGWAGIPTILTGCPYYPHWLARRRFAK